MQKSDIIDPPHIKENIIKYKEKNNKKKKTINYIILVELILIFFMVK